MALIAGLFLLRFPLARRVNHVRTVLERLTPGSWLIFILAIAIALRVGWYFVFNAPLRSDGATYFNLAQQMVYEGSYGNDTTGYAHWPPGLPFFLAPLIAVLGAHAWVTVIGNLILSCFTILLTYYLAKVVADIEVAKVASLLVAVWPNHIMSAGLASKEQLLLTLITCVLFLILKSHTQQGNLRSGQYASMAGLCLGAATLTQPSFLLFPSTFVLLDLMQSVSRRQLLLRLVCVVIGMGVVVTPWTVRNYQVFNQFVPIATNGGDVFYRANNSLATGGYIDRGEVDLSHLSELEKNRVGYALGKQWILDNPGQFLNLAIMKQILFLGDDSAGAYETLKRSLNEDGIIYILFKGLSNAYWLAIWIFIFLGWLMQPFKGGH